MRKKGDRYGTWKMRFFVLKGSHLYYMKNEEEDRVKGHIDLRGYRVIMDENAHPGSYGFRLVGNDKPHVFSSSEQTVVRGWMKALIKATIARDYTVPVTSSCNIPTIPLAEAQAMSPRPPSPATREATQRATRRQNTSQLTAHDASVLMSLDTSKRASLPSRPSRDMRRPSEMVSEYKDRADRSPPMPTSYSTGSTVGFHSNILELRLCPNHSYPVRSSFSSCDISLASSQILLCLRMPLHQKVACPVSLACLP